MAFTRTFGLVSISSDGLQLPKIYLSADIAKSAVEPSEVTAIDGIDIQTYLNNLLPQISLQDPDGGFNTLFSSIPYAAADQGNTFMGTPVFSLSDSHKVTFANGSSKVFPNVATL